MTRDRGMTLIELVVAMAIFALIAVMGLQGLSGMLRIRDRLTEIDQDTAVLSHAVALMRNDMTAIIPMKFFPPDSPSDTALSQSADGTTFSMSIGGQPDLTAPLAAGRLHRAEWRAAPGNGGLTRQVWTTLTPADRLALQAETLVMPGVQGLRIRSYWSGQGWIEGPINPMLQRVPPSELTAEDIVGGGPERYSDFLPLAIEVTLITAERGEITLIESLK